MKHSKSKRQFTLGMTSLERRGLLSLAGIYSLRMLGLFLILPVFSLYAQISRARLPP